MKHLLFFFTLLASSISFSQNITPEQFTTPTNTGANMTLGINTDDLDEFIGATIGVFNEEGTCVGMEVIQNQFFSIAIWGDDNGTPELDGLLNGDTPTFAILLTTGQVVQLAEVSNFSGYETNSLQVTTSIGIAGCTDASFLEFHTQGYTAEVDNGSCSSPTYTLDIVPEMFSNSLHTDNNMVIGINTANVNQFNGGTIGAFYDLNGDGNLECIDIIEIPGLDNGADGFFTLSLWGDDQLTEEIDGLLEGQIPTFAILTASNYVLAFEFLPEFTGYTAMTLPTFTEINFDLTIYGCMDSSYCNYNPDAEEDDGSCEGMPGCIDDHYVQYDENAACQLEGSCIQTWQSLSEELSNNLETTEQEMYDLNNIYMSLDSLFNTLDEAYNILVDNYEILSSDYVDMENSYLDQIANLAQPIAIDILEGWNIIGFTRDQEQDAVATFDGIVEYILIVKNNNADVYWPEFGFNGIGNLIPGQGYQIKVTQEINDYFYPDTEGQRIELTPTIPEWAIEMNVESHPNDTRTLVKIVNLLGQEIHSDLLIKGTTYLHLYSDGTVEKIIF